MSVTFTARANVQVNVDVESDQVWGPDCTVAQVQKQAIEAALDKLLRALKSAPGIVVYGKPKVQIVVVNGD